MLKKIVISLVLTIPFISCSDNENRRFYTKAWTINLGDYLQKEFSGNGDIFRSVILNGQTVLITAYTSDGANYLIEIDLNGNYLNHIEIDGYITHMRKLSDESVLLGIGTLDNYSVAIFQNQKLEIVNTFSFSDLGVDMILDLELTNSGILAYERNLASKEATYISLYDFSGELEWTKILDETGNKRIAYICSVYENYFYAIGGKAGLATVWKIHLDETLLWEKNFSQYYEVESAVENQMGEIFIASVLPNYDELIEKHIDITPSAEPQPIWKVNLKSTLKLDDYLLFQSLPTPTLDGGTIIILSEEISNYKTHIVKLSSSGKVQWHEIYSVGPPQGLNVLELANQNVLIISLYGIVTMYKK